MVAPARRRTFGPGGLLLAAALAAAAAADTSFAGEVPPLPLLLDGGWESADADPPGGLPAIDGLLWRDADPAREQGPRDAFRWYRIRLDLSAYRGTPLAFAADAVRDVDEAFLDGVRIGATGRFPPGLDLANLAPRLYPLPPDLVVLPGERTLVLRVWHGRRDGSVFRGAPRVDALASLLAERSARDQLVVLLVAVLVAAAGSLVVFSLHVGRSFEHVLFALCGAALAAILTTLHTGWGHLPVSQALPFRISTAASVAGVGLYLALVRRLVGERVPLVVKAYFAFLALVGAAALILSDTQPLSIAVETNKLVALVFLAELFLPIGRAIRGRQRYGWGVLAAHASAVAGVVLASDLRRYLGLPTWNVLLGAAAFLAGFLILGAVLFYRTTDQVARFRAAALTDPATRVWNRTALFTQIEERADAGRRGGGPFGLVIADLDRFKEWNDEKGHLAGDRVLLRAARALQDASRPSDLVARYGGDEFAVVLDGVDESTALPVAERLLQHLRRALAEETGGALAGASLGVALWEAERHSSAEALFHDADRALYRAKSEGRDRVVFRRPRGSSSSEGLKRPLPSGAVPVRRMPGAADTPPELRGRMEGK